MHWFVARRPTRFTCIQFGVCFVLASLCMLPTLGMASEESARISALIRVGRYDAAKETLKSWKPSDVTQRSLWALFEARIHAEKGEVEAGRIALSRCTDPDLHEAVSLLRLRFALATDDAIEIQKVAREQLRRKDVAQSTRHDARFVLAKLRLKKGHDVEGALSELEELLSEELNVDRRIEILYLLASNGYESHGRTLLVRYPDSPGARLLFASHAGRELTETDRMERVRTLFSMRVHDLLLPELDRFISGTKVDPHFVQEATLKLAIIKMRLRDDYESALELLKAVESGPSEKMANEARYRKALIHGSLGQYKAASRLMASYFHGEPQKRFKLSANYQIGRLLHQGGFHRPALKEHERFLETRPRDRSKWLWFKGWMMLRAGDCRGAMNVFKQLESRTNTLVGAKAIYWYAHCARLTGQTAEMKRSLKTLERRAPLSYYGLLGRHLGDSKFPRILKSKTPVVDGGLVHFEVRLPRGLRKAARRTRLLAEAGYPGLARSVAHRSRLRRRGRRALPRNLRKDFTAALDRTLENWGPVWKRMTRRRQRLAWTEGVHTLNSSLRQRVYPPAYLHLARAAGEDLGVSPWWLLAHMLQESRYKERAKSHAWALGPMQILPRTGRKLAEHIGFPPAPFRDSGLHQPGVALRQAASYLAMLKDEFGGNTMWAMAAYNGGPRRMSEHLSYAAGLDFASAIEEIGAHETRNYVRKIVDHTIRYAEIYGTDDERAHLLRDLAPPAVLPISKGKVRF